MSSRPLKSDAQQVQADLDMGAILAADADSVTPIDNAGWRTRLLGGEPDTVAVRANPGVLQATIRMNPTLADALSDLAADAGISRQQMILDLLAAHVADLRGIPIETLLRKTQRTGPFYAKRWSPHP